MTATIDKTDFLTEEQKQGFERCVRFIDRRIKKCIKPTFSINDAPASQVNELKETYPEFKKATQKYNNFLRIQGEDNKII